MMQKWSVGLVSAVMGCMFAFPFNVYAQALVLVVGDKAGNVEVRHIVSGATLAATNWCSPI